jgi:hypothetical protein
MGVTPPNSPSPSPKKKVSPPYTVGGGIPYKNILTGDNLLSINILKLKIPSLLFLFHVKRGREK